MSPPPGTRSGGEHVGSQLSSFTGTVSSGRERSGLFAWVARRERRLTRDSEDCRPAAARGGPPESCSA